VHSALKLFRPALSQEQESDQEIEEVQGVAEHQDANEDQYLRRDL
jgi:hypothetical protein